MPDMVKAKEFADKVVNYMYIGGNLDTMSATEAVKQTILFLASDIGAAQEFVRVLELNVDLYNEESVMAVRIGQQPEVVIEAAIDIRCVDEGKTFRNQVVAGVMLALDHKIVCPSCASHNVVYAFVKEIR